MSNFFHTDIPLYARIAFIIMGGSLSWLTTRWIINRLVLHISTKRNILLLVEASERYERRVKTIGNFIRKLLTFCIWAFVSIYVLTLLGFPVTALVTSVGIVGIAISFGTQTIIRDFICGLFITAEDQYGIGDRIETGDLIGIVETVGLRITTVRDDNGVLWYIRNGEIVRVGNHSQKLSTEGKTDHD